MQAQATDTCPEPLYEAGFTFIERADGEEHTCTVVKVSADTYHVLYGWQYRVDIDDYQGWMWERYIRQCDYDQSKHERKVYG